eukprot:COSAG03_NODE_16887_length_389_cov_1.324138_1_plen_39_part_10
MLVRVRGATTPPRSQRKSAGALAGRGCGPRRVKTSEVLG